MLPPDLYSYACIFFSLLFLRHLLMAANYLLLAANLGVNYLQEVENYFLGINFKLILKVIVGVQWEQ